MFGAIAGGIASALAGGAMSKLFGGGQKAASGGSTYQAGLRRDAVQPDIEAERKKRDEIEAGKSYCSRRFGGATCDDKSAQIYARFDKNDWRIQPAEFYRFHDAEVNTFGYF